MRIYRGLLDIWLYGGACKTWLRLRIGGDYEILSKDWRAMEDK